MQSPSSIIKAARSLAPSKALHSSSIRQATLLKARLPALIHASNNPTPSRISRLNPLHSGTRASFQTSAPARRPLLEVDPNSPSSSMQNPSDSTPAAPAPVEMSTEEYHQLADTLMDELVTKIEKLQEDREDVDVEYTVSHQPTFTT